MAIDNENLEMVELLINHRVDTKDALLHAISEEFVEAVEVLLDHEDCSHRDGDPHVSSRSACWNVAQMNKVQGEQEKKTRWEICEVEVTIWRKTMLSKLWKENYKTCVKIQVENFWQSGKFNGNFYKKSRNII